MKVKVNSLWLQGLYSPWDSPGKNTKTSSLFLLKGIFPTQGYNPGLPHHWQILYQMRHKGSQKMLEWVSLSLLQWIFLTQVSNHGLLHCRWILCQLSYHVDLLAGGKWTYTVQTHVVQGQTICGNLVKYISFTVANVYHCGKTVTN